MSPLAWLKVRIAQLTTITEFCHDCGRRQPLVWHAADSVWAEFADGQHPLCPECFDARSRMAGVSLMWYPAIEFRKLWAKRGTP